MKTITATINGDTLTAEDGSRWKRVTRIEIGTQYEYWNYDEWCEAFWEQDLIDLVCKANDLIAWNESDKPRIANRQKALLAADKWLDANGRFVPKEGETVFVLDKAGVFEACTTQTMPLSTRYFFETQADAQKFAADMGDHLKWL